MLICDDKLLSAVTAVDVHVCVVDCLTETVGATGATGELGATGATGAIGVEGNN